MKLPSAEQLAGASSEELAALAAQCLERLEPGRQPLPLFRQMARLAVLSTVELVPFRTSGAQLEVLLGQRAANDTWWPNMWHLPGSVLLPEDERGIHGYEPIIDDILKKEFNGSVMRQGDDVSFFDIQYRTGTRGSEQTAFFWAQVSGVDGEVEGGDFFNAENVLLSPPQPGLIKSHTQTISKATRHYYAQQVNKD